MGRADSSVPERTAPAAALVAAAAAYNASKFEEDQLTDESILGHTAPEAARPVLRAITKTTGPIFPRVAQLRRASPDRPEVAGQRDPVIAILGQLLGGRAHTVNVTELTERVRRKLDELVDQRILDRQRGTYRASHVALYSSFRVTGHPPGRRQARPPAGIPRRFAFRFNRRRSASRGMLFYRLLEQSVQSRPRTYRSLVADTGAGRQDLAPPSSGKRVRPPSLAGAPLDRPWRSSSGGMPTSADPLH